MNDVPGMHWEPPRGELPDPTCEHPASAREVTVEGFVACANCLAMLVPGVAPEMPGTTSPVDAQVKYRLVGYFKGMKVVGEWDDPETAFVAERTLRHIGGTGILLTKVTTESVTDVGTL